MDHARAVRGREGIPDLNGDRQRLVDREACRRRAFGALASLAEALAEAGRSASTQVRLKSL